MVGETGPGVMPGLVLCEHAAAATVVGVVTGGGELKPVYASLTSTFFLICPSQDRKGTHEPS